MNYLLIKKMCFLKIGRKNIVVDFYTGIIFQFEIKQAIDSSLIAKCDFLYKEKINTCVVNLKMLSIHCEMLLFNTIENELLITQLIKLITNIIIYQYINSKLNKNIVYSLEFESIINQQLKNSLFNCLSIHYFFDTKNIIQITTITLVNKAQHFKNELQSTLILKNKLNNILIKGIYCKNIINLLAQNELQPTPAILINQNSELYFQIENDVLQSQIKLLNKIVNFKTKFDYQMIFIIEKIIKSNNISRLRILAPLIEEYHFAIPKNIVSYLNFENQIKLQNKFHLFVIKKILFITNNTLSCKDNICYLKNDLNLKIQNNIKLKTPNTLYSLGAYLMSDLDDKNLREMLWI